MFECTLQKEMNLHKPQLLDGGSTSVTCPEPIVDSFQFSGLEPIYFIENKEKTLRASYDRDTQIVDYMN